MLAKKPEKSPKRRSWKRKIHPVVVMFGCVLLTASIGLEITQMLPSGTTIALSPTVATMINSSKKLSEEDKG